MVAPRCDSLLGVDIVELSLQAARSHCTDQPNARFRCVQVPTEWPRQHFGRIVFSEVLY
jgi:hypothetical protein